MRYCHSLVPNVSPGGEHLLEEARALAIGLTFRQGADEGEALVPQPAKGIHGVAETLGEIREHRVHRTGLRGNAVPEHDDRMPAPGHLRQFVAENFVVGKPQHAAIDFQLVEIREEMLLPHERRTAVLHQEIIPAFFHGGFQFVGQGREKGIREVLDEESDRVVAAGAERPGGFGGAVAEFLGGFENPRFGILGGPRIRPAVEDRGRRVHGDSGPFGDVFQADALVHAGKLPIR